MTREEFDELSVGKRLELIKKFRTALYEEEDKLKKNNYHCISCDAYFARNEAHFKSTHETVKGECVFRDAGYGDDDRFADCQYIVLYITCPKCGKKIETARHRISYSNERDRWGNPV